MTGNSQRSYIDVISFVIGGLICSLLSVAITIYYINSVNALLTLAKLVIFGFFLFGLLVVVYLIKRGELWKSIIGKNLHSAKENFAESIKVLLPGYIPKSDESMTPRDALENLTAIYGDYQGKRLINGV